MISFIVPAHNEELLIGQTLSAIQQAARASGESFEIIVVDDSSTDDTATIAREHGVRVISIQRRQIAASRNAGGRQARGKFLFFVDADTLATPEAVVAGIKAMRAGAVGGGCLFNFDGPLPLWVKILLPIVISVARITRLLGGCFLFCRADVFQLVGGFPERVYAAEELFFILALKEQGRFVVPPARVITSGRKARTYTPFEIFWVLLTLGRGDTMENREKLPILYAPRRFDPLPREHQLKTIK
jgi:glycosyltransferase involved in cell wall biosynthesis